MKSARGWLVCSVVVGLVAVVPAAAAEDSIQLYTQSFISAGVQVRLNKPNRRQIGKASLDPNLCKADDCIALSPTDTAPNTRFLNAPGSLSGSADDPEMSYQKGDITAAPAKFTTFWRFDWRRYHLELGGLIFYDPVNTGFEETHLNRVVTPGAATGERVLVRRDKVTERVIGYDLQLREASLGGTWNVFGRDVSVDVGRQRLRWGESTVAIQGTLDTINPLDVNNVIRPGLKFIEVYKPVGMVLARAHLSPEWDVEAFYLLEWRPLALPAKGSFFGFADLGNDPEKREFQATLGGAPEDPQQIGRLGSPIARSVSDSSLSILRAKNQEPSPWGQFGFALYHYFPEVGPRGTELGFYFANYHARIPSASFFAAQASCTRREGNPNNHDSMNLADVATDCGASLPALTTAVTTGSATRVTEREVLPIDTVKYFLDYPKNIILLGLGAHLEAFGMYWQGEAAFRPNEPVQVDIQDLGFAAFQPVFPRHDLALSNLLTVGSSQRVAPDFITKYRGGTPGEVAPGQYLRGWERMETLQTSLGFTKVRSDPLSGGASWDNTLVMELASVWVPNLPSLNKIQFEGTGTNAHHSKGVNDAPVDALRVNPIQQQAGYVDDFSWGLRAAILSIYHFGRFPNLSIRPVVLFLWDVQGVSPGLGENFSEDRKLAIAFLDWVYKQPYGIWRLSLQTAFIQGGGLRNNLADRDFFGSSLSYEF